MGLVDAIASDRFSVLAEVDPPKGADASGFTDAVMAIRGRVDGVVVTDCAYGVMRMTPLALARLLIEGVPLRKDNLTRFLSPDRYALPPLHNAFFTRDPAVVVGERALISRMASTVRGRETRIMEAIFDFHPEFSTPTLKPRSASARRSAGSSSSARTPANPKPCTRPNVNAMAARRRTGRRIRSSRAK